MGRPTPVSSFQGDDDAAKLRLSQQNATWVNKACVLLLVGSPGVSWKPRRGDEHTSSTGVWVPLRVALCSFTAACRSSGILVSRKRLEDVDVKLEVLDLGSLQSVIDFAKRMRPPGTMVNVMINNASHGWPTKNTVCRQPRATHRSKPLWPSPADLAAMAVGRGRRVNHLPVVDGA